MFTRSYIYRDTANTACVCTTPIVVSLRLWQTSSSVSSSATRTPPALLQSEMSPPPPPLTAPAPNLARPHRLIAPPTPPPRPAPYALYPRHHRAPPSLLGRPNPREGQATHARVVAHSLCPTAARRTEDFPIYSTSVCLNYGICLQ
jgi:hypothetical protein